jgi:hypothetical protein
VTIVEPLPDLQWGKGNWQDYISNWRSRDTNWMQERLILRYQTTAQRNAAWPAPSPGQVTYNDETKTLEMWRASQSTWVRSLMFQNLVSTQDTAGGVNLFHVGSIASPKAITIGPTTLSIDFTTTSFLSDRVTIDATGLNIKIGTKTAKLSTDATHLISDSPIKTSAIDLSGGTGTVISAAGKTMAVGTLNADQGTITNISASGTLTGNIGNFSGVLTGGTVNGTSGTIGGIGLSGNTVNASGGMIAGAGYFHGDGSQGVLRYRNPSGGAQSANLMVMQDAWFRWRMPNGMPWDNAAGNHTGGWVACVFTSDPGAANAPTGSILLL